MNLVSALLASTFGHGSLRPVRTAWIKLGALLIGSLTTGLLISRGLPDVARINNLSQTAWLVTTMLIAQITIVFSLEISTHIVATSNRVNLILTSLPLKKGQLEFLTLLPSLLLAVCSLTLVGPSLATISLAAGLHPLLFIAGMGMGSLSAFGMIYGHRSRSLCLTLAILAIASEYKLLSLLRNTHALAAALAPLFIVGIYCALAIRAGRTLQILTQHPVASQYVTIRSLPNWAWFTKKFWRYAPLRRSFLTTIMLGTGLAAVVVKYGALGSSFVALPAQLLAAALASDIRALVRPQLPPEIGALKGTIYFVRQSIIVGIIAGVLALLPVEVVSAVFTLPVVPLLSGIILGAAFGLFVGAWLTPRANDISAQLTANLACLCIAVGASQLSNLSQHYLYILQGLLALIAMGLTFHFEYKRNALTWRKHEI